MRAYHNTREEKYREPFGAVRTGGAVSLSLDVWEESETQCLCRLWVDEEGESLIEMEKQVLPDRVRFTCTIKRDTPCIVWYSFIIRYGNASSLRYGAKMGCTGGEGVLYVWEPPSFQLTVFEERRVPEWFRRGIVYQIFPDRFCRGDDWRELADRSLGIRRYGPQRALVEDWSETPFYRRAADRSIIRWDFYAGTLSGVEKKLDYLQELGITAIYLNPIFASASNHRYDTADYTSICEMLGGTEALESLAHEAERHGISLILDGVFNHTGADSVYFNKLGNFDSVGAFQSEDSPYRDWYVFDSSPIGYRSWWGVDTMPEVNEQSETYRSFIFGDENSVVRRWLRLGAKGWRLDVADEMPDDFLEGIKSAALAQRPDDAVVIGEVWEDASNKISYGKLRRYLLGSELDSVMNYPLRDALLGFLVGSIPAEQLANVITTLQENYPNEAFHSALNLMGSHDRTRVMTILGGAPDGEQLTEEQQRDYRLDESQRGLAKGRSWLMTLVQMLMPGVPCIYYGDEAGMEGYTDPFNRGTYPWGHEDKDMMGIYRNAISLRKMLPCEDERKFAAFSLGEDVFGFTRDYADESFTVLINRSISSSRDVKIPTSYSQAEDIACGAEVAVEDGFAGLRLYPMGSAVIRCTDGKTLCVPMERGAGILCAITSVPNERGPGNIGEPAKRFVDFLESAGQRYWQILPVNPTDEYGSPYAGASAFAANIRLLPEDEEQLRELYEGFVPTEEYEAFCERHKTWLAPYAAFQSLRKRFGGLIWTEWPEEFKHYTEGMDDEQSIKGEADFVKFCQYRFNVLWSELREYAKEHGVHIIGDMPMYVSHDSADVWSAPELFSLDDDGRKTMCAGVPPDYFSEDGQLWGNPLYNWAAMRNTGYKWWMERFQRMFELYDYVRLDHFRGFESYWAVPEGKKASSGKWLPGPGLDLFQAAYDRFGPLPVLAEDLGSITPPVRALVALCGCQGTDVLQFAEGDPLQGYVPHKGKIAYSGTHDNQTLVGWCKTRYPELDPKETSEKLLEEVFRSRADVAIVTLQDALCLGDEARMNTPGVAGGNWLWQANGDGMDDAAGRLRVLTEKTKRRKG